MKNFQLVGYGDFVPMFPATESLVNDTNSPSQAFLIHALAPPRFQDKISSRFFTSRVAAKERKKPRPFRDDRRAFIALPSSVNLPQRAKLSRYILLPQIQHQPSISKVFAKSLGQGDHTFLSQNECFKCLCSYPDRKKAKRQNRVIYIIRKLARYGGAAGQCDPRSRAR